MVYEFSVARREKKARKAMFMRSTGFSWSGKTDYDPNYFSHLETSDPHAFPRRASRAAAA